MKGHKSWCLIAEIGLIIIWAFAFVFYTLGVGLFFDLTSPIGFWYGVGRVFGFALIFELGLYGVNCFKNAEVCLNIAAVEHCGCEAHVSMRTVPERSEHA